MSRKFLMASLLCACSLAATPVLAAEYLYGLNGSYSSSTGGPALTANGGTLGATGYTFGANQGLTLNLGSTLSVYTIETTFSFSTLSGYRKIVDFKNLASDNGLYVLNSQLDFYPIPQQVGAFGANQLATVRFSRDATGLFTASVDGSPLISFNDTSSMAVFNGGILQFFADDLATGKGEASAGFVDSIKIADSANFTFRANGNGAVPEPSTWAMMLTGFALVGYGMRRKQANALRFAF